MSLTGILDHPVLSGDCSYKVLTDFLGGQALDSSIQLGPLEQVLGIMKEHTVSINKHWSELLGINPATAITCVKPSGTVSQLCDTASGIHPRYSNYYIRTIRSDNKDPLCEMMKAQGVPWEEDVMKKGVGTIFSFPVESPDDAILRNDRTALEQLEMWKTYQIHWCEHKPSVTVYVREHEWLEVFSWVYSNFDVVSGISFLPHSDHTYKQAPYQEITKEEYDEAMRSYVDIDWEQLSTFETEDATTGMKEYACTGNSCEVL